MSGLSARRRYPVAGGGCPAVKTSVWNHVLWAWGNEAKDTSAMTWWLLYLAWGVSDGRNNSGCLHASERSRVQSSVHGQGIQGPTAGLSCCAWSLQRKEIGFFAWDVFQSHSLLALFPQPHWCWLILTMTQFHSASHHRGKETLLLWLCQKAFQLFSLQITGWEKCDNSSWKSPFQAMQFCSCLWSLFTRMLKVTWLNN